MAARAVVAIMRSIRINKFGGAEVLHLEQNVAIPKPGDTQVLVKVHAAGVNPVDAYIRSGNYAALPSLPYTPGKDGAGVVEAVGSKVTKLKKGDRVYNVFGITGSYAEYMLSEEVGTFPLHKNLSFEQGAALGVPYHTAYRALVLKANATSGDSLLVHGASGAVGLAAVQIGRALGLSVYGTAGTSEGIKLVKRCGAHDAFNHREEGYLNKVKASNGGKGVNIILEMLADVNLVKDFNVISQNGTIVVIGSRGSIDFPPRLTMGSEAIVTGVALVHSTPKDYERTSAFLYSGQELGWLKPVVGQVYSLEKAAEAHTEVIAHTGGSKGKIVLSV